VSLHCSGTDVELQSLGREMASVRLMGRLKGTFPVRMRQAQSAPVRTISASEPQHCCVGDPPPLVLPVTKLRHGVNVVISDAVHDVATCPDGRVVAGDAKAGASGVRVYLDGVEETAAPLDIGRPMGGGNGLVCW
jgi:hypothetical protein